MKETCSHILLFLPDSLDRQNVGFLEGFSTKCNNSLAIFIINNELLAKSSSSIIGYCSHKTPDQEVGNCLTDTEWVHINIDTDEIKINRNKSHNEKECVITCIEYDYNLFVKTETLDIFPEYYGAHFETLINAIKQRREERPKKTYSKFLSLFSYILVNFMYIYFQIILKVKCYNT